MNLAVTEQDVISFSNSSSVNSMLGVVVVVSQSMIVWQPVLE